MATSGRGSGIVGYNAALIAIGMQANVWVLDRSIDRMRELDPMLDGRATIVMSTTLEVEQAIEDAEQALAACRLDEGTATDALGRLCTAWLDVAERYAVAEPKRAPRSHVLADPLIALLEPGSCFAGSLLELALAADRSYMLFGVFEEVDPDADPALVTVDLDGQEHPHGEDRAQQDAGDGEGQGQAAPQSARGARGAGGHSGACRLTTTSATSSERSPPLSRSTRSTSWSLSCVRG